jgi:hypothetical protein
MPRDDTGRADDWTFLTNHAHVLVCLAREPQSTTAEVAAAVGIDAAEAERIITDLERSGYLEARPVGDRTRYAVDRNRPLRHPVEAHHSVGEMLDGVQRPDRVLQQRLRQGG